ncbi:MAG: translation initiation factor IF-2 N-terminal domain-containing protein, partial [Muribaculaceae bacterium]|nr:translation initiation factor IF-2 N-terminal domain-containing protein [Muribaculaceae bacterium]
MSIKISKVIKDLNVGVQTIQDFLNKKKVDATITLNARIDEDIYNLLAKEFKPDMELKLKSEKFTNERQNEKAKIAAEQAAKEDKKVEEIKTEVEVNGPKVLGKIDLSNMGKSGKSSKKSEAKTAPAPEKKSEPAPEAKEEKAAEPVAEEKPEVQTTAPEPVAEEKPEVQTAAPEPVAQEKVEEQEQSAPEQPAATETPAPKAEDEVEIFTTGTPELKNTINVVGKIDLSAINQSTRPKKKSKEERRTERLNKEKARQAEAEGKKKRKRIGKEKVDIEKSAQQIQSDAKAGKNDPKAGKRKKEKAKRPFKPEVSEEDVQRQVKETLARLTAKTQKKSAKWRREKREAVREEEQAEAALLAAEQKTLKLTEFVTANDLAAMMNVPVNKVIGTCMNLGVMVSINQRLDAETINIVADEFGFKTEYESADVAEAIHEEEDSPEDLESRPPVVTVMGHVDHGKTSLLDYIRNSNVIAGEAGGITQHIGAYNVKLSNGRRITFLDTPGHEAFTAMRARGAKVTDIVIVIVAADDAVMPQTVEALNHASAAGVPIIFAINKIDKPGANPEKIKEELANMNYLVEDWGGKYQSQDISAKKGI